MVDTIELLEKADKTRDDFSLVRINNSFAEELKGRAFRNYTDRLGWGNIINANTDCGALGMPILVSFP
mgnify:CR=1 FL=1